MRIISTTDFAKERYKKNQELVILDNGKIKVALATERKALVSSMPQRQKDITREVKM